MTLLQILGDKKINTFQSLIGGMGAGFFSTVLNNPVDCIKTKMSGTTPFTLYFLFLFVVPFYSKHKSVAGKEQVHLNIRARSIAS